MKGMQEQLVSYDSSHLINFDMTVGLLFYFLLFVVLLLMCAT